MKKTDFTLIVSLGIILACLMSTSCTRRNVNVQEFDVKEYYYQKAMEYYPCRKNVGIVDDALVAIAKAKDVWREVLDCNECEKRPVEVYFDQNNDCWFVCGTLPRNVAGGVASIIVQADGEVLAVWHGQ